MSGPALVIKLAEAISPTTLQRLHELLLRSSARLEESRVGEYELHVRVESLGITSAGEADGGRPFLVSHMGPGIGDEEIFDAEHADEADQETLIGFTPTHAVDVIALCNSPINHVVTALLTATIMEVIGGVVNAELQADQIAIIAALPGLIATTDSWHAAYGSAEFLRAWAAQPGFRLVK